MSNWIQCGHPGCVMQIGHPGPHYTTSYGGSAGSPLGAMPWAPLHSHADWQAMEAEVDRLRARVTVLEALLAAERRALSQPREPTPSPAAPGDAYRLTPEQDAAFMTQREASIRARAAPRFCGAREHSEGTCPRWCAGIPSPAAPPCERCGGSGRIGTLTGRNAFGEIVHDIIVPCPACATREEP